MLDGHREWSARDRNAMAQISKSHQRCKAAHYPGNGKANLMPLERAYSICERRHRKSSKTGINQVLEVDKANTWTRRSAATKAGW